MTSTIYGLRQRGNDEIRYVGRSAKPLELRLRKHIQNAARLYPRKISEWIASARGIEIVRLVECDDSDATAVERRTVEKFHALGHRLTNGHLLPRDTASRSS